MRFLRILSPLVLLCICLAEVSADVLEETNISPYFLVTSGEEAVEHFPLQSSYAEVKIAGVIADVKITQIYKNEGTLPIEAKYVFPGSTRSAIYGMQMTVGERIRRAQIEEKKKAKKKYEAAKTAGKSASLLEQKRPNVFEMNVANILPGDRITVEIWYTEMLVPEEGIYEFIYPAVVGPRFTEISDSMSDQNEPWISNPFLFEGESATYDFDVSVEISTGIPLHELISTTHKVHVNYQSSSQAIISFADGMKKSGDRDFVLRYKLQDEAIESGILLYEGDTENFFTLLVEPPQRVSADAIPAREYVFVVDVSGSMYGFPLTISKRIMRALLKELRPQDTFNIILFAASSKSLAPESLPASEANIKQAIQLIDSQQGGGGTRLLDGLERAMQLPTAENVARSFIILTDGYISADVDVLEHIQRNLGNANYFAFGLGSSVNRYLIEGIAKAGYGESFVALTPGEAEPMVKRFHQYVKAPLLTNIDVDWGENVDVYDIEPKYIPDLLADRPLVIRGKYRKAPPQAVRVTGTTGTGEFSETLRPSEPAEMHRALRYLWARERIARLGDYQKVLPQSTVQDEITQLGLDYELVTAYTSFIAVDDIVRNTNGKAVESKQPLPLPQGVSGKAVGSFIPSTPEPAEWLLMLMVGGCMVWYLAHRRDFYSVSSENNV